MQDGIEFINQMYKAINEEKLYKQWVVQLPLMSKETYVSFEEYKEKATGSNIDQRPTDELEREINDIEKSLEGR